jgi:hypothetical protein
MQLDWSQVDLGARMITARIKSRKPGGRELAIPIAQPLLLELANVGPREERPRVRIAAVRSRQTCATPG